mgnify:CR=1 FL=1
MDEMNIKQCPFCAEDIKMAAIVCKHCGRNLESGSNLEHPVNIPPLAGQNDTDTMSSQQLTESTTNIKNRKKGCGWWLSLIIAVVLALSMIGSCLVQSKPLSPTEAASATRQAQATATERAKPTPTPAPTRTVQQHKDNAIDISAEELTRNTEKYIGETVLYTGTVAQVIESEETDEYEFTVFLNANDDVDNKVVIFFSQSKDEIDRLLANDKIEVVGTVRKRHEFETVLGKPWVLPIIDMIDIKRVEEE